MLWLAHILLLCTGLCLCHMVKSRPSWSCFGSGCVCWMCHRNVRTHTHTHNFSHLCLHNCSQCLHWGSWVSTDKSLAREGPRDTELDTEVVRGSSVRISPQLNYSRWLAVDFLYNFRMAIFTVWVLLQLHLRKSLLELPAMVLLKRYLFLRMCVLWNVNTALSGGNIITH